MDKNKETKTTGVKAASKASEPVKVDTVAADKTTATAPAKSETKTETKAAAKTAATKTAAKAETKTTAKKTTTKKTATKTAKTTTKAATKKAATKKADIETSVAVQFLGKEIFTANLIEEVKKAWVEQFEGKLSDIKSIELYIKPEEMKAYFVVNGSSNENYFINL